MKIISNALLLLCNNINAQSPPAQPLTGPGGSDYTHGSVIQTNSTSLWTGDGYWLFEPDQPKPD